MEQYGIFYFFSTPTGSTRWCLPIRLTPPRTVPRVRLIYQGTTGATVTPDDVVSHFMKEQEIRPGKYAMTDYNFETPSVKLAVSVDSVLPSVAGAEAARCTTIRASTRNATRATGWCKLRIEEEEAQRAVLEARAAAAGSSRPATSSR